VALEEDFNQKKLMLRDIFNSYFQIDVLTLSSFNKLDAFKRLIFLLLERVGSKLDITKLASLSGVSRDSVYSYISLLQGSYFIYLVPKYSGNRDREISGAKKVYICDNGILNLLSKVSHGSLLENSVFMNLKHYGELKYYQRRSGLEIDFILNGSYAFEVKTTGAENDIKRLRKFVSNLKISDYYLISENFVGLPQTILAYQI